MTSWKAKAERGSAWLIHLIAWIARAAGRTVCRALLVPIVAYFVVDRRDRAARIARIPRRVPPVARPAGRTRSRTSTASPRRCSIASGWRSGDFRRFDATVEGDPLVLEALESGKGCVLLGSHLGSFDFMTLKNKVLYDRPVTLLMHIDERARVRRIAGIDDSKLSIIPLGRFDSYLRAYEVLERGGIVVALADRGRERGRAERRFLRPAGAVSDRPACARGARRREGPDGLRPVRRRRALPDRVRRVRPAGAGRQPRRRAAAGDRPLCRRSSSSTPGATRRTGSISSPTGISPRRSHQPMFDTEPPSAIDAKELSP